MRLSSKVIKSPILEPGDPVEVKGPAGPFQSACPDQGPEGDGLVVAGEGVAEELSPAPPADTEGAVVTEDAAADDAREKAEQLARDILDKARAQADAMMRAIMDQAERMKQDAAKECVNLTEQARREGFKSGREQGLLAAREAVREIMDDVRMLRERAEKEREAALASLEPQMVELALAVAEKVVRAQIELKPELVAGLVREALLKVQGMKRAMVRVHEGDVDAVRVQQDAIVSGVEGLEQFEVTADRSIERGGCVVETDQGWVDATIARQLARIEELLKEVRRNGASDIPTA